MDIVAGWMPAVLLAAVVASLAGFLLLYQEQKRRSNPYPFPPGPPGNPFVGNLGQVSVEHPEKDFIRWGEQYNSDVIHTQALGQHMVALNSVQAATDLLDRKGSNYCDRPKFTLFEIMGWGRTLTFLPWGSQFKLHRRLFQTTFSLSSIKVFRPIQLAEARKAVRSLLEAPDEWKDITLLMTTSIVFRIAYGQEITDKRSPYCEMAHAASDATTAGGTPGSTLVDIFPPAKYLPDWLNVSAPLRHARKSRPAIERIREVPWKACLEQMENGNAAHSFVRDHLTKMREAERTGEVPETTADDVKGAAGAIFIAGGNTTWSTIQSCVLFLTKYPDAQRRLQIELDAVIGSSGSGTNNNMRRGIRRLPDFDDLSNLPYLERFVQEAMRCQPLNPLVIPHKSLEDDVYRGMFIPAGTVVFANAKAMAEDPKTYSDPATFDPDRYSRGESHPPGNFGFGRRKCPGNHLALASVYMFIATLMAAFDVEKAVGKDGQLLEPEVGVSVGLGGHPEPFECVMRPRIDMESATKLFR